MEERELKIYSVFLASSNELKDDRDQFAVLLSRLNDHYNPRGYKFILKAWEFLDPAYHNKPKQDEYNEVIKQCDLFVALFHTKAGKYTVEELQVARHECEARGMPLFIYFRDLDYWQELQKKNEDLEAIKKYIGDDMKHFWGSYSTNDKLHLDFVLWLDKYLFDGKSDIKVENGNIMLDDVIVTKMMQLPFATNNKDFKRMYRESQELLARIEDLRQRIEKYPEVQEFKDDRQEALNAYYALTKEFEVYQQSLLDTAKFIADRRQEHSSNRLQRAINAFESGDLPGANAILQEIESEADEHMAQLNKDKTLVHQDIDAFQLQAKTVMTEVKTPIGERIARVAEIYAKADDWANRSAYKKEKYAELLFEYGKFLDKYAHYDEGVKVYLRQIALSEELYGKDSTETAASYNNIGMVYWKPGEYDKALEYYFKALTIREKILGIEHTDTATSYNEIGVVYIYQGKYDKALEYHFKALTIREKILGTEHSDTAESYNNIGGVYWKQGEYGKALKYHFKALAIKEKVLGTEHPSTATTYNNIGMVYIDQGKYDKALEYYFKALEIDEKVLGTDHPDTATDYNISGWAFYCQGNCDKALENLVKALVLMER